MWPVVALSHILRLHFRAVPGAFNSLDIVVNPLDSDKSIREIPNHLLLMIELEFSLK